MLLKVDHFWVIFGQKPKIWRFREVFRNRFGMLFCYVLFAIGSNRGCLVCLVERQCFVMSLTLLIFYIHYIVIIHIILSNT